jgi:hypothetical protein
MAYRNYVVAFCLIAGLAVAQPGPPPGPRMGPGRGQQNAPQNQPAPVKPEDLGSIEGQVFNAVTGEPLKKATVSLRRLDSRGQPLAATADASGQFLIAGVEPGRYRLFADRNGFVRQEYGARGPERPGTSLTVDKGQRLTSITLRLSPQAVITGRILDEDGDPVRNVHVQAMRSGYYEGRRQLVPAGNTQTNDLGEYRLYDLPGGKYYVSAVFRSGPQVAAAKERYLPAYYPASTDPSTAVLLVVPGGAQLQGIDMTLRRGPSVVVRGKIVNAGAIGPTRGASIRLVSRGSGLMVSTGQFPSGGQADTFEIRGVIPGPYTLVINTAAQRRQYTYRQPLDVGSAGIDNLTVTIPPPADLQGDVRVDGQTPINFGGVTVTLRSFDSPSDSVPGQVKPDGGFNIPGLMPGRYELSVSGLPAGFYLKSARFGSEEVVDSGLNLTGAGKLDVLVSPAAAQVDGVVLDGKQQPAKGTLVALIPDAGRQTRTSLYKTVRTDDAGRYAILGIAPGSYNLYAFEDIESGAYLDPDFIKPLEKSAEGVTLRENGRETRQLRQIPIVE